jgi:hypothetical protein
LALLASFSALAAVTVAGARMLLLLPRLTSTKKFSKMCSGQVAATSCTLRCCSSHSLCTAAT